ncbi:MAG: hypothetical protein FWD37_00425 [Methanomassiliicoccaceae archaeon]|nr:hypothetical protein [Methanomassiliicoccaceae archaeon]
MTVRPLLSEYQIRTLKRVKESEDVKKSELYSGRTEQKYFEELLEIGLLDELKHGIHNKKTIKITDAGIAALSLAEKLKEVMNRE